MHHVYWWLSKSAHFVQVYLKSGCSILNTSPEWATHSTKDVATWPDQFLERMEELTKLSERKRESNRKKSKEEEVVDLCGDTSFDEF